MILWQKQGREGGSPPRRRQPPPSRHASAVWFCRPRLGRYADRRIPSSARPTFLPSPKVGVRAGQTFLSSDLV